MAFTSDATIRALIKSTMLSAINSYHQTPDGVTPLAVIYQWGSKEFSEAEREKQWVAAMRSDGDLDAQKFPRVHGYGITRIASEAEREGNKPYCRRFFTYFIRAFHWYAVGTEEENSEMRFSAELDAISSAFDNRAALDEDIRNGWPLSWRITPDPQHFGGETLHLANGTLIIEPCRVE